MKRYLVLPVFLAGCATQSPIVTQMDQSIQSALGQPISVYERALGEPAVVQPDGALQRYVWRQADLVKPCELELWADNQGLIRRSQWNGYPRSCKPIAEKLP